MPPRRLPSILQASRLSTQTAFRAELRGWRGGPQGGEQRRLGRLARERDGAGPIGPQHVRHIQRQADVLRAEGAGAIALAAQPTEAALFAALRAAAPAA